MTPSAKDGGAGGVAPGSRTVLQSAGARPGSALLLNLLFSCVRIIHSAMFLVQQKTPPDRVCDYILWGEDSPPNLRPPRADVCCLRDEVGQARPKRRTREVSRFGPIAWQESEGNALAGRLSANHAIGLKRKISRARHHLSSHPPDDTMDSMMKGRGIKEKLRALPSSRPICRTSKRGHSTFPLFFSPQRPFDRSFLLASTGNSG